MADAPARRAVVLLSGGLDSYTAAAAIGREGYALHALTLDYGQRHRGELDAARAVAADLHVARHITLALDLRAIGGSALTAEIAVPKDRALTDPEIPITYVPARNTILLSLAMAWAEVLGAEALVIGVNALDYSGYPDCRPEFIAAFERLSGVATRAGIDGRPLRILTPLIALTKAQIITLGHSLGCNYALTTSCYDPAPNGDPCLHCDSCRLRAEGFAQAGLPDPLLVRTRSQL